VPSPAPAEGFGSGSADFARHLWWERRLRTRFFPVELFGEPAWDLILAAFAGASDGAPIRVSKSHLGACVAPSVAERRAHDLVGMGIMAAEPIKKGSRFRQLTLTREAQSKLQYLLEETWFHRLSRRGGTTARASASSLAARTKDISDAIAKCREELDTLELWEAGAHLSQAISALERGR
jgi:hypothetical protein